MKYCIEGKDNFDQKKYISSLPSIYSKNAREKPHKFFKT